MTVVTFARLRELVGAGSLERALPDGASVDDAWRSLAAEFPALAPLRAATRLARNGTAVAGDAPLRDGDELALLPPFGGG